MVNIESGPKHGLKKAVRGEEGANFTAQAKLSFWHCPVTAAKGWWKKNHFQVDLLQESKIFNNSYQERTYFHIIHFMHWIAIRYEKIKV